MVFPLIPIGTAALGIGAGFGISEFLGGSKKGTTMTYSPTYSPVSSSVDSRQFSYQYSPQYGVQIQSPQSSITKKDQLMSELPSTISPNLEGARPTTTTSSGTDFTKIAIIAAVALIGYGLVSKK